MLILSHDPSPLVRGAAAESELLPVDRVLSLLDDNDPDVRESAAGNPILPAEAMFNLLTTVRPSTAP